MTYPVIEPREDDGSATPGRFLSVVFPALLFVLGFALFAISFNVGDWGAWTFAGGIVAVSLAFAIPTTIVPALENRA
ncbi:hypothetical protein [Cellulomonas fengjieae]|uniref:Uncharacterized protein n=1 Tax=Cellulomonas fengjieae TaxID=2819978 RepID=A0ABS3SH13_9CELL|nr:hypothetical protein [Cellulomonas fengjieae]MBO3084619.1 hypothetical protein [Cellulomonas fengjieae]MBO3103391.1 hypothetical protein [Cellulomonas fengjieae]QVI67055.1 hypothetical protein KG102_05560 [Cellulomonas fengjieae]